MNDIQKIIIILSIGLFLGSCNKNSDFVDVNELVPQNNPKPLISLFATIVNNNLTEIDLHDETAPDVDLTINGHSFCYGTDSTCLEQNISNFESVFGNTTIFRAGEEEMNFYCPEMIFFDTPQTIDINSGFTLTWNVDENNRHKIVILIKPLIDSNGNAYTSDNIYRIQIVTSDNGHYTISPQDLTNLNSGDIVEILMIRANKKQFFHYYIESFTLNTHTAVVQ